MGAFGCFENGLLENEDDASDSENDIEEEDEYSSSEEEDDEEGSPSTSHPAPELEDDESCPVCLNEFTEQQIGVPDNCKHVFCVDCILEWSKNSNSCPVDRIKFENVFVYSKLAGLFQRKVTIANTEIPDVVEDDLTYCQVCGSPDNEDTLLLCDGCDHGYHCACLNPPLDEVPHGEWFCVQCQPSRRYSLESVDNARTLGRTRATERVRAQISDIRLRHSHAGDLHSQIDAIVDDILARAGARFEIVETSSNTRQTYRAPTRRKRQKSRSRSRKRKTTSKKGKSNRKGKRSKSRGKRRCNNTRRTGSAKPPAKTSNDSNTRVPRSSRRQLVPSLTMMGRDAELDEYLAGEDEHTPGYLIAQKHRQLSCSALRFNTPLPSILTLGSRMDELQQRRPSPPPAPVPDLLGSILSGQEVLMTPSSSISIQRGGTLRVKRPKCPQIVSNKINNSNAKLSTTNNEVAIGSGEKKNNNKNRINLKNERYNGRICANSPDNNSTGKSSSKTSDGSASGASNQNTSNGEQKSSVGNHLSSRSNDISGQKILDDKTDNDHFESPSLTNSAKKRFKIKRFNQVGQNSDKTENSQTSAVKTGRKIQIKRIFNLPNKQTDSKVKKGATTSEDVYDPFDPTEDDEEPNNNGAEEDIYDPFEPTLSEEENEEKEAESSTSGFSKFSSHGAIDVKKEFEEKQKDKSDDITMPESSSKSAEKDGSFITDLELDELLDSNLDAAEPVTKPGEKAQPAGKETNKSAPSPEFDMFADPEPIDNKLSMDQKMEPDGPPGPSSAWRKKVRSLSSSQDATSVVKLPGFSSGATDSTPVHFKKFKVRKSIDSQEKDHQNSKSSLVTDDSVIETKIENQETELNDINDITAVEKAEEIEANIKESSFTEEAADADSEKVKTISKIDETKATKSSSRDRSSRHRRSRSKSRERWHREKSPRSKHRSHRHGSRSSSHSRSKRKSSRSRSGGRHGSHSRSPGKKNHHKQRSRTRSPHYRRDARNHDRSHHSRKERSRSSSKRRHSRNKDDRDKSNRNSRKESMHSVDDYERKSGERHRKKRNISNDETVIEEHAKENQDGDTRKSKKHKKKKQEEEENHWIEDDLLVAKEHTLTDKKKKRLIDRHSSEDEVVLTEKSVRKSGKGKKQNKKKIEVNDEDGEIVNEDLKNIESGKSKSSKKKKKRRTSNVELDAHTEQKLKSKSKKEKVLDNDQEVSDIDNILEEDFRNRDADFTKSLKLHKKHSRRSKHEVDEKDTSIHNIEDKDLSHSPKRKKHKKKKDAYSTPPRSDNETIDEERDVSHSHKSKKKNKKLDESSIIITVRSIEESRAVSSSHDQFVDESENESSRKKKARKKRKMPKEEKSEDELLPSKIFKKKKRKGKESDEDVEEDSKSKTRKKKKHKHKEEVEEYFDDNDYSKKKSVKLKRSSHKEDKSDEVKRKRRRHKSPSASLEEENIKDEEQESPHPVDKDKKKKRKKKSKQHEVRGVKHSDLTRMLSSHELNSDCLSPLRTPTPPKKEAIIAADSNPVKVKSQKRKEEDKTSLLVTEDKGDEIYSPFEALADLDEDEVVNDGEQPATSPGGDEMYSPTEAILNDGSAEVTSPINVNKFSSANSPLPTVNKGVNSPSTPLRDEVYSPSEAVEAELPPTNLRSPSPMSPSSLSPESNPVSPEPTSSQEIKETLSYAEEFLEQSRKRWQERKKTPSIAIATSFSLSEAGKIPVSDADKSSHCKIENEVHNALEPDILLDEKSIPVVKNNFSIAAKEPEQLNQNRSPQEVKASETPPIAEDIFADSPIVVEKNSERTSEKDSLPSNPQQIAIKDLKLHLLSEDKVSENNLVDLTASPDEKSKPEEIDLTVEGPVTNTFEEENLWSKDVDERKDLLPDPRFPDSKKSTSPRSRKRSTKSRSPRRKRSRSKERERDRRKSSDSRNRRTSRRSPSPHRSRNRRKRSVSPKRESHRVRRISGDRRKSRSRDRSKRSRSRSKSRNRRREDRFQTSRIRSPPPPRYEKKSKSPVPVSAFRSAAESTLFSVKRRESLHEDAGPRPIATISGGRMTSNHHAMQDHHHDLGDEEFIPDNLIPKSNQASALRTLVEVPTNQTTWNTEQSSTTKSSALIQINTSEALPENTEQIITTTNTTLVEISDKKIDQEVTGKSLDDKLAAIAAAVEVKRDTKIIVKKDVNESTSKKSGKVTPSTPPPPPPPPPTNTTTDSKTPAMKIPGLRSDSSTGEQENDAYSPTDDLDVKESQKLELTDKAKEDFSDSKKTEEQSVLNPTQILNFIGLNPQQKSAAQNAILSIAELSKHLQLDKFMKSDKKHKGQVKEEDGLSPVSIDNIESSAVEMYNKGKETGLLKKLQFQERVVEEAKLAIKPYYERREIDKHEYKEIMKRAVNKICSSENNMEVNNVKIRRLIRRYIEKYQQKSSYKKEKMRSKLDGKINKQPMASPDRPSYEPLTPPHPGPKQASDGVTAPLNPPSLLKREPRKIVTLPDLPLPPPPPPPRPSYMP